MMKMQITTTLKLIVLLFCSFFSFLETTNATNYYIRTDGNDNNTGLANTPSAAWKTINTVLYGYANWGGYPGGSQGVPMLPGDTLWINDGTYIESGYGNTGLKIDGINGSNTNRFFIKAVNKGMAKLELSSDYNSFNIYNSKGVTIDGLDIYSPAGSTNIHIGVFIAHPSEFVTIRNCKLHNFGLGAVGGDGDNIIIERNEVYENATRNPGNGSGISFYHPKKVGSVSNTLAGGFGHIIRENLVYNNYCSLYYTNGNPPTDGNGIIVDDFNFTQNSSGIPYTVPTLIENNICFKNGGSGIRVYDCSNVTVRNNTCYYNCWVTSTFPSGSGDYPSGDIGVSSEAGKGNNINITNNICISDPNLPVSNHGIGVGNAVTNVSVMNNYTNKIFFTAGGSANVIGNTPQFVNATTSVSTANFHLTSGSPAINIGLNSNAAAKDYDANLRPQNGIVDAGAYEYVGSIAPVISGVNSICVGTTSNYTASTVGGTWSSSATNIASISTNGTITGISAGVATITYKLGVTTVTKSITINALPNAGTISSAASICAGTTTIATASVAAGSWTITPSSVATINATGLITGVSAGIATISYTVTTNGCSKTANKSITVNALPSAGIISASASICATTTIPATASIAGGKWTISPTSVAKITTTGIITGVSAGAATISYTVTTSGCSATATKSIIVNTMPSAGTISAPAIICVGNTTTATASVVAGSWAIEPSSIATISATGLITAVSAGTATISYTVTTNGCSKTVTRAITVNPAIAAPTFSVASGTLAGASSISLATITSGATIRYTVNNTTPTPTLGTIYATPINVNKTQTIKAIAYTSATCASTISSATYTFYTPIVVRARSVSAAGASIRVDVMGSSSATGTMVIESQTFNNLGTSFADYTFNATSVIAPQLIRVSYINDAQAFDLEVDYIKINGITYQTEATTTYGIGVWNNNNNCNTGGFFASSLMQCNGYFHYRAVTTLKNNKATVVTDNANESLTIYPNPTDHTLRIGGTTDLKVQKITILNINGQVVKQFEDIVNELNVEDLQTGTYFLQIEFENQPKEVKRFVKM